MVIIALIYLATAHYLASWLKRHFALSAALPSLRLMLFSPMLFLLSVVIFHRSLPREIVFRIDYAISLLGAFSVCWTAVALAGDLLESIVRRSRPGFSFGRNTCYSLIIFAGLAVYVTHRMFAPFLANAKHKEALFHLQTQNWNAASRDYDTAILLSSGNGVFYFNRGLAYLHNGDINKALADAAKAVELLGAEGFDAYMFRAGLSLRQRKFTDAIADYTKALSLKESTEAYMYRAYAHLQNSDYENAISDSSKFISSAPHYPDGYEIRGLAYRKKYVASKGPPDPKDAQAAIFDILKACDLGNNKACNMLNAVNDTGFNYAAYDTISLPSFMGSYISGLKAIQAELAKVTAPPPDKRDIMTLDAAPRKIVFLADYTGRVRTIPRNKLKLIASSAKSSGQEHFASLYKKEINISSEGGALWMPIQQNLLVALKKEFKNNDKVFFYVVVIGAIREEAVPLATEFKTIHLDGTPFFENNDKADQYLLGPDSSTQFPASASRPAIVTAK